MIISPGKRQKADPNGSGFGSGILDERVLVLVFKVIRWDLHALCSFTSVNRKVRAIAKRYLWRELCFNRAPRMVAELYGGGAAPNVLFDGEWHALTKLMFYCCGCAGSSRYFRLDKPAAGHFSRSSRFSKTSGRSFLSRQCRGDLLYVSDPCEHPTGEINGDDLGVYRGVFRGFQRSMTRACLIRKRVGLEEKARCPYCRARVWSMTAARLIPRSAARRLGSGDGQIEYFVCLNGHLHGTCWLAPLSSDDADDRGTSGDGTLTDFDDDDDDDDRTAGCSGSTSSTGEQVAAD